MCDDFLAPLLATVKFHPEEFMRNGHHGPLTLLSSMSASYAGIHRGHLINGDNAGELRITTEDHPRTRNDIESSRERKRILTRRAR